MSDRYVFHDRDDRGEDWQGGPSDEPYKRFRASMERVAKAAERLSLPLDTRFSAEQADEVYDSARSVLEQAGVPFVRAVELAERIRTLVLKGAF